MENIMLYVYAMTNDSGFAPCVTEGLLTLACCKGGKNGGMRRSVKESKKAGNDVWVMGVCGKTLARKYGKTPYAPIFLARITGVMDMAEYYKEGSKYKNRKDGKAYTVKNGELESTDDNPHRHSQDEIAKDKGGKYVLLSENFTYWGDECGTAGSEQIMKEFDYIFTTDSNRGKSGIDKHYRGHIVEPEFAEFVQKALELKWVPKAKNKCKIISTKTINGDYLYTENENSKNGRSCGGKKL